MPPLVDEDELDAADVEELDATEEDELDAADVEELDATEEDELDAADVEELDAADVEELDATDVEELDATDVEELDATDVDELDAVEEVLVTPEAPPPPDELEAIAPPVAVDVTDNGVCSPPLPTAVAVLVEAGAPPPPDSSDSVLPCAQAWKARAASGTPIKAATRSSSVYLLAGTAVPTMQHARSGPRRRQERPAFVEMGGPRPPNPPMTLLRRRGARSRFSLDPAAREAVATARLSAA